MILGDVVAEFCEKMEAGDRIAAAMSLDSFFAEWPHVFGQNPYRLPIDFPKLRADIRGLAVSIYEAVHAERERFPHGSA